VDTLVGTSLGGYTLIRLLGSGGMGAVYLAADSTIGQQVAIKIVRTDAADYPDIASAIRAAERFKQEARAVASLDHLHILPLYRYGEEQTDNGQRAYMVMQYRPEGSLWDWIRQRASQPLSGLPGISPSRSPGTGGHKGPHSAPHSLDKSGSYRPYGVVAHTWPLDVEEVAEYLRQAASALQYAHDMGIIHRDIKPANFLLRFEEDQRAGRPQGSPLHDMGENLSGVHLLLSDFGLAKFFSSSSATSHIFGTPIYMAPEQFNGEAGPESDQYALAIMIYYLLTGHPPFEGDPMRLMHQHLFTEPPPPRTFNPALPEGVEAALLQALSKKPSERHPSIAAFANAFAQGIAETTVVPIRRTPSQAGPQRSLPLPVKVQDSAKQLQTPLPGDSHQIAAFDPLIVQGQMTSQAAPEAPTVANSSSAVQPAVSQAGLLQASPDTPTVAQVTPAQANAALAPTVFPLTPQVGNNDGRAETPRGKTSLTLPAREPLASNNWSPTSALPSSPGKPFLATLAPAQPVQTSLPTAPDQQRMSRRSALGWIIGGVAAVGIGGGVSIYFYTRHRTPTDALSVLRGHSDTVTSLNWSPDGFQLVSGSRDGTAHIWLANDQTSSVTYTGHSAAVLAVAWSPDGTLLASGGEDKTVQLWNTAGALLHSFSDWGASISSLAWENNGKALFVGTLGAGVHELLLNTGERPGRSNKTYIHAVALSPSGNFLAIGAASGQVVIVNTVTFKYAFYRRHTGPVLALAWSQDGTMLASGGSDSTAQVWDPTTGATLHSLSHDGVVNGIAWEPGNTGRLASASADSKVRVWDINSGGYKVYTGHGGAVTSAAWGLGGLATGSADTDIIVWRV
jgi:eukaryotic-like serine/threonine-protein kinase